jgi:hypothetical protein
VIGRRYWIWIWYGILAIGIVGLVTALYWGRRTGWKNLDEIARAIGTITVSVGMILLLQGWGGSAFGVALLIIALFSFILAFVLGRNVDADRPGDHDPDDAV